METLLGKFENYVAEHNICSHGDRILLAVSGGVDSMVMLSLFAQSGYRIGVAHCNFQLRGPEAEEDEQLVAECAEKLGVPHYNIRFDTLREMERTRGIGADGCAEVALRLVRQPLRRTRLYAHRHCPPRRRFGGDFFHQPGCAAPGCAD